MRQGVTPMNGTGFEMSDRARIRELDVDGV
jgi:hypothetical protein